MRLKVLLTEGSSTSARQTLYALGRRGYTIDVCDPQRLCLGRFSRFVRRWYLCPSFTADPLGYLDFLSGRLCRERYDVLFPVHDQVYLLARFPEVVRGLAAVALPPQEAIVQLQSKAAFSRLLSALGMPQPCTSIMGDPAALAAVREFPCYVKLAYSTAGRGVWRADNQYALQDVIHALQASDEACGEIVVQRTVGGIFHVAHAVFQHGELVAAACSRARAAGVGGSAHARQSVAQPTVCEDVARLGRHLAWHGALHIEYFCDPTTGNPVYIEVNPRIGETMNATLAGLNLCDIMVHVSLGDERRRGLFCKEGTRTHSVLMSLMAKAESGQGRRRSAGGTLASLERPGRVSRQSRRANPTARGPAQSSPCNRGDKPTGYRPEYGEAYRATSRQQLWPDHRSSPAHRCAAHRCAPLAS